MTVGRLHILGTRTGCLLPHWNITFLGWFECNPVAVTKTRNCITEECPQIAVDGCNVACSDIGRDTISRHSECWDRARPPDRPKQDAPLSRPVYIPIDTIPVLCNTNCITRVKTTGCVSIKVETNTVRGGWTGVS